MYLLFVELADQAQREECSHVLEVWAHLHVHLVPSGIARDFRNGDLSSAQRPTTAYGWCHRVHIGNVLADPLVQFILEIEPLFPGTDLFAL